MTLFLTDEDFNGRIVRGMLFRQPDLDLVRAQDVGLSGATDPTLLDWAERHQRVLLTHDGRTMPNHVRARLAAGFHVVGVFIVDDLAPIGRCIEDLLLVAECSVANEWQDQVRYLPFR